MIDNLKTLLTRANAGYVIEQDENEMMKIRENNFANGHRYIYIEEYKQGHYSYESFRLRKTPVLEIYFSVFSENKQTAEERELQREQTENEIVIPFIKLLNDLTLWSEGIEYRFFHPLPRFDENEVTVMLQFEYKNDIC
ncbi:MAG: hypothetical protein LUG18_07395 [Candidatus Azobacteroides sp.]|nr:hypothetical protein [Candidatus Azobacteroides sp.]